MKITRRTDYAIHMIATLAASSEKTVGLRALADGHKVTYAFARTVQQGLLKAGIVATARGVTGGVRLAKNLEDITLLEVFEATQDPLSAAFSSDGLPWCNCPNGCITKQVWASAEDLMRKYYASVTMQDIIA